MSYFVSQNFILYSLLRPYRIYVVLDFVYWKIRRLTLVGVKRRKNCSPFTGTSDNPQCIGVSALFILFRFLCCACLSSSFISRLSIIDVPSVFINAYLHFNRPFLHISNDRSRNLKLKTFVSRTHAAINTMYRWHILDELYRKAFW